MTRKRWQKNRKQKESEWIKEREREREGLLDGQRAISFNDIKQCAQQVIFRFEACEMKMKPKRRKNESERSERRVIRSLYLESERIYPWKLVDFFLFRSLFFINTLWQNKCKNSTSAFVFLVKANKKNRRDERERESKRKKLWFELKF